VSEKEKQSGLFGFLKKNAVVGGTEEKENTKPHYIPWYDFNFDQNGVYVRFYNTPGINSPLKRELICYDIERRKIENADTSKLNEWMLAGEMNCRVAPPQEEKTVDGGVYVLTARDEMTATLQLLPPVANGKSLTTDEVLSAIKDKYTISFGLDENAVCAAVDSGFFYEPVTIAQGKPAVAGTDAYLNYHFKTNMLKEAPRAELPVYNEKEFFTVVREGDVLVEKTPYNKGIAGITVRGMTLNAVEGRDCRLPEGAGVTASEDGIFLYAAREGRPYLMGGRVLISDVMAVSGDVDLAVGDIDFDGDVLISGNVQSGMIVRATGNIQIGGAVEAAAIDAGRDIVLFQGMQGADTGALRAGGDIYARYIIRASVEADGNLYGDYVVSSQISVMGMVRMMGSHAKIFGGMLRASSRIWVNAIGTVSGEKTTIEIGSSPKLRKRLLELEDKRTQTKVQLEKIDNLVRVPVPRSETPERLEMRKKLVMSRDMVLITLDELAREIEDLKAEIKRRSDGRLHVRGEVAAEVRIVIDGIAIVTRARAFSVSYRCRDGAVVAASYEGDGEES